MGGGLSTCLAACLPFLRLSSFFSFCYILANSWSVSCILQMLNRLVQGYTRFRGKPSPHPGYLAYKKDLEAAYARMR